MTKKKFISDYTERFRGNMIDLYDYGGALEKMLGEVYDKMKRPTSEEFHSRCVDKFTSTRRKHGPYNSINPLIYEIYKEYLSDRNGGDSADTVSE